MDRKTAETSGKESRDTEEPQVLEEIVVEELSIDGICGVYQPVPYRLADNVQVRKESWGLLFYRQTHHKVSFVRSGGWLFPAHFDGTWTRHGIVADIAGRTGTPSEAIEPSLKGLTGHLIKSGVITDELR